MKINSSINELIEDLVNRGIFESYEAVVSAALAKFLAGYYGIEKIEFLDKEKGVAEGSIFEPREDEPVVIECRVQQQGDGSIGYIRVSSDREADNFLPSTHNDFMLKLQDDETEYYSYLTRARAINVAYTKIYPKIKGPKGFNHLKTWLSEKGLKRMDHVYLEVIEPRKKFQIVLSKPTYEHILIEY